MTVAGQRRRYGDRENPGLKGAELDSNPKGPAERYRPAAPAFHELPPKGIGRRKVRTTIFSALPALGFPVPDLATAQATDWLGILASLRCFSYVYGQWTDRESGLHPGKKEIIRRFSKSIVPKFSKSWPATG